MMTRLMSNSVRVVSVSSSSNNLGDFLQYWYHTSTQCWPDNCSFICVISNVPAVKKWIGSAIREAMTQYTFQRKLTTTLPSYLYLLPYVAA